MWLCATSTKVGKSQSREVSEARGRDAAKKRACSGLPPTSWSPSLVDVAGSEPDCFIFTRTSS